MSFFSRKKNHSPSNSAPANELASQSLASQQRQSPTKSQSQSHPQSQQKQQSPSVHPWSAHAPQSRSSPSPFPRYCHALSTIATAAGELFLFGGYVHSSNSLSNDLYVISTRDFSTTLLKTSGDVPSSRYGHCAVLTSTVLLIWGGMMFQNGQYQAHDDSLYLLNLVSREWTRIVVNGPEPGGRYFHTMTLVGSGLFVFGGRDAGRRFNDIWALDLNCLNSNPFWESYELAPGNEKPLPRSGHVSVTTGDRIIIFGGYGANSFVNDTWSFDISTRKWTELQCTGSTPPPHVDHAAVLVDDVMYVFGGETRDGTYLGDLTALNLSTQRWIAFQDIGPSPCGRRGHAMACDGTSVFVLGGELSPGAQVNEAKLIHVLDTKLLIYPEPDSNTVRGKRSEKTTQLVGNSSASPPTQGQPHQPTSSSDAHAAHGASPFQKATPEELDHPTSRQITREQNSSLNGLPSRPTGASGRPRRVPEEDDDGEGSTEHRAKLVAPGAPSGKEIARLEDGHLIELERELSETLVAKTERDRRIGQLTDELALKSALLEQAVEEKKRAGLELRELQAKLGELMLSRDEHLRTLEQAQCALQEASSRAADANERSQRASEQIGEYETKLAEVRAELEETKSKLEAVRSPFMDAKDGRAKSSTNAEKLRTQNTAGPVNTDEDLVTRGILERMRAMEAEIASLRWSEKIFEMMECRNED